MNELVAWLGGEAEVTGGLTSGALVAARIAPLAFLAPWLALRSAPPVIRAGVILALTAVVTPVAVATAEPVSASGFELGLLIAREVLIGAIFAVATALPLHALDWGGRLIDTWRGASLAEVIAPPTGERTSPLGDLYLMMGVVLFVLLGGHRLAIEAFADGLAVAPIGTTDLSRIGPVSLGAARLAGSALAFAVAVAAPAAAALVLMEVALGLVARAAPQIPVFFAGMPLRAAVGIAAVLLGLSVVVGELPGAFGDAVESASGLLRLLR